MYSYEVTLVNVTEGSYNGATKKNYYSYSYYYYTYYAGSEWTYVGSYGDTFEFKSYDKIKNKDEYSYSYAVQPYTLSYSYCKSDIWSRYDYSDDKIQWSYT